MAGSALPPFDIVSLRHSFEAFNPPVKGIILHFFEDFVCFAHEEYDTKCDSTIQGLFMVAFTTALGKPNHRKRWGSVGGKAAKREYEVRWCRPGSILLCPFFSPYLIMKLVLYRGFQRFCAGGFPTPRRKRYIPGQHILLRLGSGVGRNGRLDRRSSVFNQRFYLLGTSLNSLWHIPN